MNLQLELDIDLVQGFSMQSQTALQESHDAIMSAGEYLSHLARDLNIIEFEKKLPGYIKLMQQYFIDINETESINTDNIELLMNMHNNILHAASNEKENISNKLKKLHIGKTMQSLYPKNIAKT